MCFEGKVVEIRRETYTYLGICQVGKSDPGVPPSKNDWIPQCYRAFRIAPAVKIP